METQDLKEMAWIEYGQDAYEAEMRLREMMERGYDPYSEIFFVDSKGGRYE